MVIRLFLCGKLCAGYVAFHFVHAANSYMYHVNDALVSVAAQHPNGKLLDQ